MFKIFFKFFFIKIIKKNNYNILSTFSGCNKLIKYLIDLIKYQIYNIYKIFF